MKMVQSTLLKILMAGMLLGLAACGGGESDQGNLKYQAVASLSFVSSSTDPVGVIQFDLILPEGFVLLASPDGKLAKSVLTPLVVGTTVATNYQPETTLDYAVLTLGLINANHEGLPSGKLLTLTRDLAIEESLPASEEFRIENLQINDRSGLNDYGIAVSIERNIVAF